MRPMLRHTIPITLATLVLLAEGLVAQEAVLAEAAVETPVIASGGGSTGGGGAEVLGTIGQPLGPDSPLAGVDDETIWLGFWAVIPSDPTSVREERLAGATGRVMIAQIAPNPFVDRVAIDIELARAGHVVVAVHDALGREIARLVDGAREIGGHRILWRPENLPAGSYIVRLEVDGVARGAAPVQHYR
jgi:hypothetical protein